MDITIVFGTDRQGFDNSLIKIITFAPIVKWISQSSSERLCRVQVLVGAPSKQKEKPFWLFFLFTMKLNLKGQRYSLIQMILIRNDIFADTKVKVQLYIFMNAVNNIIIRKLISLANANICVIHTVAFIHKKVCILLHFKIFFAFMYWNVVCFMILLLNKLIFGRRLWQNNKCLNLIMVRV